MLQPEKEGAFGDLHDPTYLGDQQSVRFESIQTWCQQGAFSSLHGHIAARVVGVAQAPCLERKSCHLVFSVVRLKNSSGLLDKICWSRSSSMA